MTPVRVVAVGCGWVTTHRHIPSIARTPGLRLVGVVDRDVARREAASRQAGVPGASSLDDPALPAFDAVTIGTAPPSHAPLARHALGLGKHVIVEKPLAMSPAEADDLAALAGSAGRTLAVVHNFQFARSTSAAREAIASGRHGTLRGVVGVQLSNPRRRLPTWYRELPGGLFYDESPHLFYLVRAFAGRARVAAVAGIPSVDPADPTPRHVSVAFDADGGRFAALSLTFDAAVSEWYVALLCERGTLVCDLFRDVLVALPDDGGHRPLEIMRTSAVATLRHWLGVARSGAGHLARRLDYGNDEVFRRFAEACRTGLPPQGIDARDGAAIVSDMHATLSGLSARAPSARA